MNKSLDLAATSESFLYLCSLCRKTINTEKIILHQSTLSPPAALWQVCGRCSRRWPLKCRSCRNHDVPRPARTADLSALSISLWTWGINRVSEIFSFYHRSQLLCFQRNSMDALMDPTARVGVGLCSCVTWITQFSLRSHLGLLKNWRGFSDFMEGGTGFLKTQLLLRAAV